MGAASVVLCPETVTAEYDYQTMPRTQVYEVYTVQGFVWISKPGAGETVIKAARDAAYDILEDVIKAVAQSGMETKVHLRHKKVDNG